jgi:hypothetical protein
MHLKYEHVIDSCRLATVLLKNRLRHKLMTKNIPLKKGSRQKAVFPCCCQALNSQKILENFPRFADGGLL